MIILLLDIYKGSRALPCYTLFFEVMQSIFLIPNKKLDIFEDIFYYMTITEGEEVLWKIQKKKY